MSEIIKADSTEGLDPNISAALRELAGWPVQQAEEGGYQHVTREREIHYDAHGRVTGATERIREEEFRRYSNNWIR